MTGYESKRAMAQDKLAQPEQEPVAWMVYTQEGQSAFVTDNPAHIHPSQRALPLYATPQRTEQNFCHRCGKRTKDIHTCTPPQKENT